MPSPNDITIIGSGPAGLTAAIYLARANIKPVIYAGLQPGGQLTQTTEVENFPGFKDGIMGPELMTIMTAQAERFGTQVIYDSITAVDFSSKPLKLWADKTLIESKAVIIATGATARDLGTEVEKKFSGRGISYCATCDGFFYKGKKVGVIGGGDSAMEEAHYLSHLCSEVVLINRRDEFRASYIMIEKAKSKKNIKIMTPYVLHDAIENNRNFAGIKIKHVKTGEIVDVPMDGLFIAIGHNPNSEIFKKYLEVDSNGFLVTHDFVKTKVPGVFAAGDIADPTFKQAVTAAGMGCQAALTAQKYLEQH